MPRPIHHTFGPLVDGHQVRLALDLLLRPDTWLQGESKSALADAISQTYNRYSVFFSSGREALLALLQTLDIQPGDEVILQGYTCAVVPNAIRAAGATPVYVDIDKQTLNLDPEHVQAAITPKTRAVLCQHTFGIPADTAALRRICNTHQLALIEDCAHILPAETEEGIGSLGDAIILSFGRDKAISGVSGGAVLTPHAYLATHLDHLERHATTVLRPIVARWLLWPLWYALAKLVWPLRLGKPLLILLKHLRLLVPIVSSAEKHGRQSRTLRQFPNAMAALTLQQWKERNAIQQIRREHAEVFLTVAKAKQWQYPSAIERSPAPQKFPLYRPDADSLRARLKKEEIYLQDGWSAAVVNPAGVDQASTGYIPGSCPVAEQVSRTILSLPTHPSQTEADRDRLIEQLTLQM